MGKKTKRYILLTMPIVLLLYIASVWFRQLDQVQAILLVVLFGLHLAFNIWVLYYYIYSRKKVKNKLHLYNKLTLVANGVFLFCYIGLLHWLKIGISENYNQIESITVSLVMLINIIIQENNTFNFIDWGKNLPKLSNNGIWTAYASFRNTYLLIFGLWIFPVLGYSISVYSLLFLSLLLNQRSLAFTTFAQNKYWNFIYEFVLVSFLMANAYLTGHIIWYACALMAGLVFIVKVGLEQREKRLRYTLAKSIKGVAYDEFLKSERNYRISSIVATGIGYFLLVIGAAYLMKILKWNMDGYRYHIRYATVILGLTLYLPYRIKRRIQKRMLRKLEGH